MELISLDKGNDFRNIIIILKAKKRVKKMKRNKVQKYNNNIKS